MNLKSFTRIPIILVIIFTVFQSTNTVNICQAANDSISQLLSPYKPYYKSILLIENQTGQILHADRIHRPVIPASVVKLMTALITLEKIKIGELALHNSVKVSRKTSRMGGSQVYLREGEVFTIDELLKAMIVASANDSTHAIAEYVAGNQENFVRLMNQRASELKMKNTHFVNVHGLPPRKGRQDNITTAFDLSILAREILKHPEYLSYSSIQVDYFRNGSFQLVNTNRKLLRTFPGMDGLKTGYHRKAGFNLVSTAQQNDIRLISIVIGSRSMYHRSRISKNLLETGFEQFDRIQLTKNMYEMPHIVSVIGGDQTQLKVTPAKNIAWMLTPNQHRSLKKTIKLPKHILAPVVAKTQIGSVEWELDGKVIQRTDLLATDNINSHNFWGEMVASIERWKYYFDNE